MEGQYETETFTYPNAIVRVHFPAGLTDEENRKRMKKIRKAAEELLKEQKRGKEKKM